VSVSDRRGLRAALRASAPGGRPPPTSACGRRGEGCASSRGCVRMFVRWCRRRRRGAAARGSRAGARRARQKRANADASRGLWRKWGAAGRAAHLRRPRCPPRRAV